MSIKRISDTLAGSLQEGYVTLCCETPLKVWFGNNGLGTSKSSRFHRRSRPHAVRRRGSDREILSADPLATRSLAAYPLRSAKQPLQYQRISGGVDLSAPPRAGTDRNDRTAPP